MRLSKYLGPIEFDECYIAGGAVLSKVTKNDVADYDIYPKSKKGFESAVDNIMNDGFLLNISDKAITLKTNDVEKSNGERTIFQIMTYDYFKSPEQIFDNFDFTVCMGAFDTDTGEYTFHDDFYRDIASNTLRFNTGTKYPINSLMRLAKYKAKGFYASKPELLKMALTVANNGFPSSWGELEREIGGTYGREIQLATEGVDYSFVAAIEVLSGMEHIGFTETNNEDLGNVKVDKLFSYLHAVEKQEIIHIGNFFYSKDEFVNITPLVSLLPDDIVNASLYTGTLTGYVIRTDNGYVLKSGWDVVDGIKKPKICMKKETVESLLKNHKVVKMPNPMIEEIKFHPHDVKNHDLGAIHPHSFIDVGEIFD